MITLLDIKKAINNRLKGSFPSIELISQDVEKGFKRPSMTVYFDNVKIETLESQIETSLSVQIYYFPDLKGKDESLTTLDVQSQLPLIFGNKLSVKDRTLNIIEPTSSITDGILLHEWDMLFEQGVEVGDTPLIENLIYNGK